MAEESLDQHSRAISEMKSKLTEVEIDFKKDLEHKVDKLQTTILKKLN